MKGYELAEHKTINTLSKKFGFETSKRFGQNFIINKGLCPKIVEYAQVTADDCVLEIGTGIGTLTAELATEAHSIVTMEVDERLRPVIEHTLGEYENVTSIFADVLKTDLKALVHEHFGERPVKVVANLPYYITSPIIMELLCGEFTFESLTVMVQKEAAVRLCAEVGTRECGAVSVAVSYYSDARRLFDVSPGSFYPPPKVSSGVIQLVPKANPDYIPQDKKLYFKLVKAGFAQRRKTLINALSAGGFLTKEHTATIVERIADKNIRAERMTQEMWCRLADEFSAEMSI